MTKRRRVHHLFAPDWDTAVKPWVRKFLITNKWRCDKTLELDDLMQEAYVIYLKIYKTYPYVIETANFMGLYRVAMVNWMHDQARKMSWKRGAVDDYSVDPSTMVCGIAANSGYLKVLLSEASPELKLAIEAIITNPEILSGPKRLPIDTRIRRTLGLDRCKLSCHTQFQFTRALKELLYE